MMKKMPFPPLLLVLLVTLLQGCAGSGIKPYSSQLPANLVVKKKAESGSSFSSIKVYLDVFAVDGNCQPNYLGSVPLEEYQTSLAVPVNRYSLLSFRFEGSSFLGGSSSRTHFDTLIKPRNGNHYEAVARYRGGIYNVSLSEIRKGNKRHELPVKELYQCK